MQGRIERYSVYQRIFGNRFFVAAISLLVIVIAMKWLVDRLDLELDRAESVQFQVRLAELRAAVTLMQASVVAKGGQEELEQFVGSNPMDWIKDDVAHYLGSQSLSEAENVAGNWVYDPALKVVAYMPNGASKEALLMDAGITSKVSSAHNKSFHKWLRFKVVGLLSKERPSQGTRKVSSLELIYIEDK